MSAHALQIPTEQSRGDGQCINKFTPIFVQGELGSRQ